MKILDTIFGVEDLRRVKPADLTELAQEIREMIIQVIATNGGHLASSLGVVELTIALHYIFNTPADKIIWDVGHQSYAHKILTGRKDQFHTVRLYNGISGFPKREESEFDVMNVGHSSTSISAAYGFAVARDLNHEKNKVMAVIGDGALTAGLAFEGLNNAGASNRDFIVILNDNRLSISKNVGALSKYLVDMLVNPSYNKIKSEIWDIMEKNNFAKEVVRPLISRLDTSLKSLLVPGILFEKLGFRYIGPLNGHNIPVLLSTFENIKKLSGPVLVHVLTTKGKGYQIAENNAEKYHGIGGTLNCITAQKSLSFTQVFGQTMLELAKQEPRMVTITAAMGHHGGLSEFSRLYPQRFFDVGIAEQHALTFAAGMALDRKVKPVVMIYNTFLQRGYDSLVHDIALPKANVLIALDRSGLVGADGPTHHGSLGISFLRIVPNLIIAIPRDGKTLRNLLYTGIDYSEGPMAVLYPRGDTDCFSPEDEPLKLMPIGQSQLLKEGNDMLVVAAGTMVQPALQLSAWLDDYFGISTTVLDLIFVKPLDKEKLLELAKSNAARNLVVMEENALMGGIGSAILELLANHNLLPRRILRIGIPDRFITHGSIPQLYQSLHLMPEQILGRIIKKFYPAKIRKYYEHFNMA